MISTTTQESAVAATFAATLPTASPVTARASSGTGDTADAVLVSYVGDASADLAVQLIDAAALIDGLPGAPLADRLHEAIDAAVSVLGAGVLGEATHGDAASLFADPATQAFDLQDAAGNTIGRLAVRITRTAGASAAPGNLHRIAGVEMDLTVEIGHTRMAVRDVLGLEPGRIVELDRSAGAPADIKLNGRLIAHGEVVVVDQDYAVRITRILENTEG
ncbi:flagellar motor switch protein FliN/FliY [Paramicrobacterium humi]|uniref:Flagellar motor switch protein FliN/FliY n=1 Tax=Paramicrobacterium humi TaxID=640635 RepID=A0A1H4N497_9MICO|nr:flagellar motor switch protein FliN [Microbacterium humi]SEB89678.1 flagellar motor switch protein FliN/FliY [Microbacterium humi]